jgi:hypothetical protein
MQGDAVESLSSGPAVSLSALAAAWEVSRETVKRRLDRGGVGPAGSHKGNAVFPLVSSIRALRAAERPAGASVQNPDEMSPMDRRAHYQAERERLELELRRSMLVPADEVRAQMARVVKSTVQHWDALEDDMEREASLSASQLEVFRAVSDRRRSAWADDLGEAA